MKIAGILAGLTLGAIVTLPHGAMAAEAGADVRSVEGEALGTVTVSDTPSGMAWVSIELTGLPPGRYAVHLHETGDCSASDFTSAGGHIAGDAEHGVMVEGGPHPGDLPNVTAHEDGAVSVAYFLPDFDVAGHLIDDDGAAFLVHDGEDDYESQPTGDAGSRRACGEFAAAD